MRINGGESDAREVIGNFGSESSESSEDIEHHLTEEENRQVQKLISEGMLPAFARAEVLREGGRDA